MKTRITLLCAAAASLMLVACGEKSQELRGASGIAAPVYDGTGVASFTATGWKAGDAQSWSQGLRARGQYGENEYSRVINK